MYFTEGDYNKRDEEDGKFCLLKDLFEQLPDIMVSVDI